MKLLVIGSGGREHTIAWKLSKSAKVDKIYVAPGNGGTATQDKCENVNITDIDELVTFAKSNNIDLTVVGPEDPLTKGIVNKFKAENLKIFGPDKFAAQLEGSKSFSKEFMKKYNVRTAAYETFTEIEPALKYIETCEYPVVVKADGLAAGKGVEICETREQAENALKSFMVDDVFNGAGKK
ncbi:MAG: phosphoribosylamine--glycine ligase, partial [Clostridiaceae bacterium]|nr:phosphoribosylamine--glycine ligase [Clostridiaceae bacterium]